MRSVPVQVLDVEVDREVELRVTYDDGVTATFPVLELRRACPCAGCRGQREQGRLAYEGDTVSILDAELHGNWGISLRWSDGHDTGIYAWQHLRHWWDAEPDSIP
ncbi:MAG: DUF971 domain-containing protein [Ilumatobacteraceae bacterium]